MRNSKRNAIILAAAITVGGMSWAWAEPSKSDALRAAPAAVQAAVVKVAGTNKIEDFDTETDNGKTVYEVEYNIKGMSYAADIDPSGAILEREVEVDQSFLPASVTAAANKAHPDGKIGETSINVAGDQIYFSVDVKVGKDEHEINIGADGKVIKDSIESPEADETPDAGGKSKESGEKEDKD